MIKIKVVQNSTVSALQVCSVLAFIFILEELLLPISHAGMAYYHMDALDYRLALIATNIPIILVWFFGFWGYSKLRQYSKLLKKAPEAKGYRRLAEGLTWLAWSLPVSSILSRLLSSISDQKQSLHSATIILTNYTDLIMPFIAFLIIGSAARLLLNSQKWTLKQPSLEIMCFILVASALYCFLILKAFNLNSLSSTNNPYHLPAWLMIVSLIVPYLYAWFIGLLAAYQLSLFSQKITGIFYRRALIIIIGGLTAIIASFIVVQYLSAIWPAPAHLIFNYRLILTTLVRIVGGLGFVVLAIGANKLKMIEEI